MSTHHKHNPRQEKTTMKKSGPKLKRETAAQKYARQEKTAKGLGLVTDAMLRAAGKRQRSATMAARRLSLLGVMLLSLVMGCTSATQAVMAESMEEVVPCEDPDHRIPVWCRSGAAWSRCTNTPCPTRCSEGHIVRCSCCSQMF